MKFLKKRYELVMKLYNVSVIKIYLFSHSETFNLIINPKKNKLHTKFIFHILLFFENTMNI